MCGFGYLQCWHVNRTMNNLRTACDLWNAQKHSQMSKDGVLVASVKDTQQCPRCEAQVPRIPHPKELAELAEEVRQRMIKAERTSYWRQFEQGMLGRDAVLVLIHLADTVMDTPERLIAVNDLTPYWKIPFILMKIVSVVYMLLASGSSSLPLPLFRTHFFSPPFLHIFSGNGCCRLRKRRSRPTRPWLHDEAAVCCPITLSTSSSSSGPFLQ